MITLLTQLEAKPKPSADRFAEGAGVVAAVHFEMVPGGFVHFLLTQDGLLIRHGEIKVGLPIHELITLALQHDPRLGMWDNNQKPVAVPPLAAHDDHFKNK